MKSYYKILLLVVILLCGTSKASKIDRAMLYAVQKGDIALIDKVIERGGNIHARYNNTKESLLHMAAVSENNSGAVISHLIKLGLDPNTTNANQIPPIFNAIVANNIEAIKALAKGGADLDFLLSGSQERPLSWAASFAKPETVEALIEAKANVNSVNKVGATPLLAAIDAGAKTENIKLLLKAGANVKYEIPDGRTALHLVAQFWNDRPEVLKALVEAGADINCKDKNGYTPLHYAAAKNTNALIIKELLSLEADINAKTKKGQTPLNLALASKNRPAILTLKRSGAK